MIKQLFIFFVKIYQNCISPYIKSNCRFYPTCSQFAIMSLQKYPFHVAMNKIIKRILSCHYFSPKNPVDFP